LGSVSIKWQITLGKNNQKKMLSNEYQEQFR